MLHMNKGQSVTDKGEIKYSTGVGVCVAVCSNWSEKLVILCVSAETTMQ